MSSWPDGVGPRGIGESHTFVLRLTVERRAGGAVATWLRLEEAERGEVAHFNDISVALDGLRQQLDLIVSASREPRA